MAIDGPEARIRKPPRLYFAAPLFSIAERHFNEVVVAQLASCFDIFLPQRDGKLIVDLVQSGVSVPAAAQQIFKADVEAIRMCDLLIAVLDGRTIDEGVAFEVGIAYAWGRPCFGLQTDSRRLFPMGNNPMIASALKKVFADIDSLMTWAQRLDPHSLNER